MTRHDHIVTLLAHKERIDQDLQRMQEKKQQPAPEGRPIDVRALADDRAA